MTKYTLFIPILLIGIIGFSQEENEPGDTTKIKLGKTTMLFYTTDPDADDYDFDIEEEDTSGWGISFDLGANGYMAPDYQFSLPAGQNLMELDYARSRSFSINGEPYELNIIKERLYMSSSLGLTWNNYVFKNNINISTANNITSFNADSSISNSKYKLRATYIQIPVMIGVKIGKLDNPLGLQVGIVGGYKIGSKIKQEYNLQDTEYKTKIKDDYNINPFKLDAIARISIGGDDFKTGLFARYSLTTLFENNKGSELYPFSAGIIIGSF